MLCLRRLILSRWRSNENPFPPLPAVRSALVRCIDAANRYPEFLPDQLRGLVASRVGVGADQVVLGAGVSGVVMQVLHALTAPGDRIVLSEPTFDGYPIFAQMARLRSVVVPIDKYGHQDLAGMAEAGVDARVVVICRPHNPTGTLAPVSDIEQFLERVSHDTVVLLDEAYIEFVAPKQRIDGPDLIGVFPMWWCCGPSPKPMGWPGCASAMGSGPRRWPASCGPCSCPSVSVIAARWRWRRLMTPKPNYANVFDGSPPSAIICDDGCGAGRLHHRLTCELRVPAVEGSAVARGLRRERAPRPLLPRRRRAHHHRQPRLHPSSTRRGREIGENDRVLTRLYPQVR